MQPFLMRKHFFHNEERGYFKTEQRAAANPMQAMGGMYVLPMCVRGGGSSVCRGWGALLSYIIQHTPTSYMGWGIMIPALGLACKY